MQIKFMRLPFNQKIILWQFLNQFKFQISLILKKNKKSWVLGKNKCITNTNEIILWIKAANCLKSEIINLKKQVYFLYNNRKLLWNTFLSGIVLTISL